MERVLLSGRWAVHLSGGLIQPDVSIRLLKLGFILSKDILQSRHLRQRWWTNPCSFHFSSQLRPSNTGFSPWATTGGSCISWVWYLTATWSYPNKGNDPPLFFFKWNYFGCNLRCWNNFLYSTSERMDTADPVSTSMLTGLPFNDN